MKLSIIILSYNTKTLLQQTLQSIPENPNWEIIVVDNASSDGSSEMVKSHFPSVKLVQNAKNLGFAAGNNRGILAAQGEYIMLLNSDTQIIDQAIQTLIDYLDTHPKVGVLTPKVILPDGAIDLACHRGLPTPWRAFTYFAKLEQLLPNSRFFGGYHLTHKDFDTTHQIEATAGTAMMVRREVIDQVGPLDEQFFFYAEDLDWCKRISEAGWQIVYHPEAVILHLKSQSGKKKHGSKAQAKAKHHFWDTMKLFYKKHYQDEYPQWVKSLVHLGIDLKKKFS